MSVKPVYMMAFTPHPHDAEAGIGGTTARWTQEGKDVVFVVCDDIFDGADEGIYFAVYFISIYVR